MTRSSSKNISRWTHKEPSAIENELKLRNNGVVFMNEEGDVLVTAHETEHIRFAVT